MINEYGVEDPLDLSPSDVEKIVKDADEYAKNMTREQKYTFVIDVLNAHSKEQYLASIEVRGMRYTG